MLKKRIITGSLLVFLALYCVLGITAKSFFFVTLSIFLLASWEWAQFVPLKGILRRTCFTLFLLTILVSFLYQHQITYDLWVLLSVLWWMLATYFVCFYPRLQKVWQFTSVRCCIALVALIPFFITTMKLRSLEHGQMLILFVLLLVWSVDTGAYFIGRWLGKTRLIPAVSPNKTWAGFIGGLVLSVTVGMVMAFTYMPFILTLAHGWRPLVLVIMVTSLAAVLGDLTQSMFKRSVDLKDSGRILPGHGGILDRFDSLIAAIPIFVFSLYFIGSKFTL